MDSVTSKLAGFASSLKYEDLPESAVAKTKEIILDSIGCALGGYATQRGKISLNIGGAIGAQPEATAIGYRKLSCPAAGFINGELINCLDFDAIGPMGGHVVPYVLPAVLAAAEKTSANGRDLIAALALGLEIGGRAVCSVARYTIPKNEPPFYEEAPRYSYNSTVFGAIAGAGWLLRLSEEKIRIAFGIGGASTPVPGSRKWLHLAEPSNFNLKYGTWSGWVAMLGVVAALAAENGFTADPDIFGGDYGYWQMCGSPFFKEDVLAGGLGKIWHITDITFKKYPACNFNGAPILAVERLVRENGIHPEDIDEIVIYGAPLLQTPQRFPANVRSNEDAQFSNKYLMALAACYDGSPGPHWQLPESLVDAKVRALMPRVKVKIHPRADRIIAEKVRAGYPPAFYDTIAEITAGGNQYKIEIHAPRGSPANPMTRAELEDKFRQNARHSPLKSDAIEKVIDSIWRLDELDRVPDLTTLLKVS